jgi:hypothetical protein
LSDQLLITASLGHLDAATKRIPGFRRMTQFESHLAK